MRRCSARRLARTGQAAGIAALMLATASCSSGQDGALPPGASATTPAPPADTSSVTTVGPASTDTLPAPASPTDGRTSATADRAEPVSSDDVRPLFTFPRSPNAKEHNTVLGVSDAARVLAFRSPMPNGETPRPGGWVVVASAARELVRPDTPDPSIGPIAAAAAYDHLVVWRETSSAGPVEDVRIHTTGELGTGLEVPINWEVSTLRSRVLPTRPDSFHGLATDGTHIYWTGGSPAPAGEQPHRSSLFTVDKAFVPREVARNVFYPTWTGKEFLVFSLARPGRIDALPVSIVKQRVGIRRYRLVTGHPDARVIDICATSGYIAVATADTRAPGPVGSHGSGRIQVWTRGRSGSPTRTLDVAGDGTVLACGRTFLAWGNGTGDGDPGQYVLDLASGVIRSLASTPGASLVYAAGDVLAWATRQPGEDQARWQVGRWLH